MAHTPLTTNSRSTRTRPHLIATAGFLVGAMVSISANVADAQPGTGSRLFASFWPVALLIGIEVITRERWAPGRARALARYCGTGTVALVAATISYGHLSSLLMRYGENSFYAHIGPLAIDGLMVVCGTAMIPARAVANQLVHAPATAKPAVVKTSPAKPAAKAAKPPARTGRPSPFRKTDDERIADLKEPALAILRRYNMAGKKLNRDLLRYELQQPPYSLGCSGARRDALWRWVRQEMQNAA